MTPVRGTGRNAVGAGPTGWVEARRLGGGEADWGIDRRSGSSASLAWIAKYVTWLCASFLGCRSWGRSAVSRVFSSCSAAR